MKKIIFILFIFYTPYIYSQIEGEKDSTKSIIKEYRPINEKLENYLNMSTIEHKPLSNKLNQHQNIYSIEKAAEKISLNSDKIDFYQGPAIENQSLGSRLPFTNDYNYFNANPIRKDLWLTTHSYRNTYPTIGEIRTVDAIMHYKVTDWMAVSAGPYVSKYTIMNPNLKTDYGVSGQMKFKVSDKLKFNLRGQYSAQSKKNAVGGPLSSMYQSSYYGGGVEFRITEKFGVEAGVVRELDPISGKWVNMPYIIPVFYRK